jgi:catechol 2,3-dioxygenase-like lactoylglutathione lyase family enzyme
MTVYDLDHILVAAPRVPDAEERARAFYGGLLGLVEIDKPQELRARGGVWFAVGPRQLHIGLEDNFRPARKAHPAFSVGASELQMLQAQLRAAGYSTTEIEEIDDMTRFYVDDPFGNRLEMVWRMEVPW